MMDAALLNDLQYYQTLLLDNVRSTNVDDYKRQFHPDLSPLGWHLGHCVFTEIYWVREILLNDTDQCDDLKALYVPEFMPRDSRAAALPPFDDLCRWAGDIQSENRELIKELSDPERIDTLLEGNFLLHFLNQHYAQHYETTMYIFAQRRQHRPDNGKDTPPAVPAAEPMPATVTVPAGVYSIGSDRTGCYDNEYPAFSTSLGEFQLAKRPVTNAEYLRFIENGGYDDPAWWTQAGRQWRQANSITRPDHWRVDDRHGLYGIDETGVHALDCEAPVHGISYYEAAAFAAWAGARLPHEYEWEAAKKSGLLENDGRVWEWCANPFHPYEGFRAFPYDGYSVPWFDDRHFTLRGGSDFTRPCVRRPSFRNYYEADKRHIRAGIRLVFP